MPDEAELYVPSFHGEHRYGIDDSRRVMIPAKWRPRDPSVVFTVILWPMGIESHLLVLPPDRWKGMLDKLKTGSINDEGLADLERAMGSTSAPLSLDRVGRFCLPEHLWKPAGLEKEAHFVGRLDKFEIWSPARYQASLDKSRIAGLAAKYL